MIKCIQTQFSRVFHGHNFQNVDYDLWAIVANSILPIFVVARWNNFRHENWLILARRRENNLIPIIGKKKILSKTDGILRKRHYYRTKNCQSIELQARRNQLHHVPFIWYGVVQIWSTINRIMFAWAYDTFHFSCVNSCCLSPYTHQLNLASVKR